MENVKVTLYSSTGVEIRHWDSCGFYPVTDTQCKIRQGDNIHLIFHNAGNVVVEPMKMTGWKKIRSEHQLGLLVENEWALFLLLLLKLRILHTPFSLLTFKTKYATICIEFMVSRFTKPASIEA